MGYERDIADIVTRLDKRVVDGRQTILLSATLSAGQRPCCVCVKIAEIGHIVQVAMYVQSMPPCNDSSYVVSV